jgi:anti-sigma regulatory factor (Ser/Thr protein kinase)
MSPTARFRHEAFLYADRDEFLNGATDFVTAAVAADEPVLIMLDAVKLDALRSALGASVDRVQFADMRTVGPNPARIIPAWRSFVAEHGGDGRRVRGIGEPTWPGLSPDQLVECRHHETLLNRAFADTPGFWLLCPFDTGGLATTVVEAARTTHPYLGGHDRADLNDLYRDLNGEMDQLLHERLPAPPEGALHLDFDLDDLAVVRHIAAQQAVASGFRDRVRDVELIVGELTTNSVRHGRPGYTLQVWEQKGALVIDIHDNGLVRDPMIGRYEPASRQIGGRGLWIVNQVCDLLQIRSAPGRGTTVRAHIFATAP